MSSINENQMITQGSITRIELRLAGSLDIRL